MIKRCPGNGDAAISDKAVEVIMMMMRIRACMLKKVKGSRSQYPSMLEFKVISPKLCTILE